MVGTPKLDKLVATAQETHMMARRAHERLMAEVEAENTRRFALLLHRLRGHGEGVCGGCYRRRDQRLLVLIWGYSYMKPRTVLPVCPACLGNRYRDRERFPFARPGETIHYRSGGVLKQQTIGPGHRGIEKLPYDVWVASRTVTQALARYYAIQPSLRVDHRTTIPANPPQLLAVR